MAFELNALLRVLHVLAASIWLGGGLFMVLMISPVVRGSGMTGKAFMMAIMRAGGLGRFFGPVALTTVVFGLVLYYRLGYHSAPFASAGNALVSIGAILAVLALAEGLAVSMPTEAKLKKLLKTVGPQGPTPEQGARLEQFATKLSKAAVRGLIMVGLTFMLMLGRTLA